MKKSKFLLIQTTTLLITSFIISLIASRGVLIMVIFDKLHTKKNIFVIRDANGNIATGRTKEDALENIKKRGMTN